MASILQQESEDLTRIAPEGVQVLVVSAANRKFYIVIDSNEEPAVYSSIERMEADGWGQ